jgi:hypothetical protein
MYTSPQGAKLYFYVFIGLPLPSKDITLVPNYEWDEHQYLSFFIDKNDILKFHNYIAINHPQIGNFLFQLFDIKNLTKFSIKFQI